MEHRQHNVLFIVSLLVLVFALSLPTIVNASSWLSRFSFFPSHLQIQANLASSPAGGESSSNLAPNLQPAQAPSSPPASASSMPLVTPSSSPAPAPQQAAFFSPAPTPQATSSSPIQSPDDDQLAKNISPPTQSVVSNASPTQAPEASATNEPALNEICDKTDYPKLCRSSVIPYLQTRAASVDRFTVLKLSIDACLNHTQAAIQQAATLAADSNPDTMEIIQVCQESYAGAVDMLKESVLALSARDIGTFRDKVSSVITNIGTCDETFGEDPEMESSSPLSAIDQTITHLASNILAIGERI